MHFSDRGRPRAERSSPAGGVDKGRVLAERRACKKVHDERGQNVAGGYVDVRVNDIRYRREGESVARRITSEDGEVGRR